MAGSRTRNFAIAAGLVLAEFAFRPAAGWAASDPDAVTYRRHVMKAMGEHAAALGLAMQQKGPSENVALHARTLALTAEAAVKAFEAKIPGGEAKDEIWRNWPDFLKRMKSLSISANELAVVAEREGLAAAQAKAMAVLNCKSCHDTYRSRLRR